MNPEYIGIKKGGLKVKKVSSEYINQVDRTVEERFGVSHEALMENAGYQVADLVRKKFDTDTELLVLAGPGNNGGDGIIAARRLDSWGFSARLYMVEGGEGEKYRAAVDSGVDEQEELDLDGIDVVVDAMIGINIKGEPREPYNSVIQRLNCSDCYVISVDVPTGIEPDSGDPQGVCVRPDCTVQMGFLKKGLDEHNSGEIWLADVSYPKQVYLKKGMEPGEVFGQRSLYRP